MRVKANKGLPLRVIIYSCRKGQFMSVREDGNALHRPYALFPVCARQYLHTTLFVRRLIQSQPGAIRHTRSERILRWLDLS